MKFLKTNVEKALSEKGVSIRAFAIEHKIGYSNFFTALKGQRRLKESDIEAISKFTGIEPTQLKAWQLMDKYPELTDPKFLMYVTQAMENKACG